MRTVSFVILWSLIVSSYGQRTIGVVKKTADAIDGYYLYSPIFSREVFLVDNCGELIQKWTTASNPGTTVHLLPSGDLLRAERISGSFTGGGIGGRLSIYDWDGQVKWQYDIANDSMHQHHIVHPMPNGNLLVVAWKKYRLEDARAKGFRVPLDNSLISDVILEIKPIYPDSAEIVWQWDFWDHTVQDVDTTQPNYGVIYDHPERLDVNYQEDPGGNPDEWIHLNALDYDEVSDQIVLSSKFHNEIYIIDHSTTTTEAKGSQGGRYGRGGDLIYRWGNPRSYARGTRDDHHLYGQHDVQWIPRDLDGGRNILLFNNGSNREGIKYSTAEELVLPRLDDDSYELKVNKAFEPISPLWIYPESPDVTLYSSRISGTQRLPDGRTLICSGNQGKTLVIDRSGTLEWSYISPVNAFGPSIQGNAIINNDVFDVKYYPSDYIGLQGRDLSPKGPIETYPNQDFNCSKITAVDESSHDIIKWTINHETLFIENIDDRIWTYQLSNVLGQTSRGQTSGIMNISHLDMGWYSVRLHHPKSNKTYTFAFLKN
jgi:hypothetical protein